MTGGEVINLVLFKHLVIFLCLLYFLLKLLICVDDIINKCLKLTGNKKEQSKMFS